MRLREEFQHLSGSAIILQVFCLSCTSPPSEWRSKKQPISVDFGNLNKTLEREALLKTVTIPKDGIVARWYGTEEFSTGNDKAVSVPLEYRVNKLKFFFPDGSEKNFIPEGTISPSEWSFNIFSPDYNYVLLLQSHFGPYHLIPIGRLNHYLDKRNPEDFEIILYNLPDGTLASPAYQSQRWYSPRQFSFEVCFEKCKLVFHNIKEK